MKKIEKALVTCEYVLEGIENETLSTSSSLLQCLKIARLLGDSNSVIWLQYEYGGYPKNHEGKIKHSVWEIGFKRGRGFVKDGKDYVFAETASELEAKIANKKSAITNFTTQGASVSGERAVSAMSKLTGSVVRSTADLLESISIAEKRLAILRANYYNYALKKSIELNFGYVANDIFNTYRRTVDNYFSELPSETILKLQEIEDNLNSTDSQLYSEAVLTCKKLVEETAVELFDRYYPNFNEEEYTTISGKKIDVSGEHYKNKLSAVIEKLQGKTTRRTLVGSSIIYILDWIENIINLQAKEDGSNISRDDVVRCILHTYICLGDIVALQQK